MTVYFLGTGGSNTSPYDTEAKAATTVAAILAVPPVAGDIVKVNAASTFAENFAANQISLPAGVIFISVTFNGSGTGAYAPGAIFESGTNGAAITRSGFGAVYGIDYRGHPNNNGSNGMSLFSAGAGSSSYGLEVDCKYKLQTINSGANINAGSASASFDVGAFFVNPTFDISGGSERINFRAGRFEIYGGSVISPSDDINQVFQTSSGPLGRIQIYGMDFSALTGSPAILNVSGSGPKQMSLIECKLPSGWSLKSDSWDSPFDGFIELIDCHDGDTHLSYIFDNYMGTITEVTSIYLDCEYPNGTAFSLQVVTTANANTRFPLRVPLAEIFHSGTTQVTPTAHIVHDSATNVKNDEVWLENMMKVSSGFTLGTWNRADKVADPLTTGADQAADSAASWTIAGGFTNENKQKLEAGAQTPAEVGIIVPHVLVAKASWTGYICPNIELAA